MTERGGVAGRAVLAVGLMAGFYALALGIAGALLFIPYAEWVELGRVHVKLAIICLVSGGTILWAVVPRPDRFEAPGPALSRTEHPRLFELIERVARATGQVMPAEVYLVRDMNAFVSQRGGIMGLGSRRVMGLGLPLLQALTVTQLEAVLAHEFGHYHGGDVKLGPWIYKTRHAIVRTVHTLAEGGSLILRKPFEWYGLLFLRITQSISRRQEHAADALAAQVVGARPLSEGLKLVHGGALGFELYWREDVLPALEAGFRPPLLAGFTRFLAAPRAREIMDRIVADALKDEAVDPYDTHPPLPERLAALARGPALRPGLREDPTPAAQLLDGTERLEHELLLSMAADPARMAALIAIDWSDVGERIYPSIWDELAARVRPHLAGVRPGALPDEPTFYQELGHKLLGEEAAAAPPETLARYGASQVAIALSHHLVRGGWRVRALPGEAVVFERAGAQLEPFTRIVDLAAGKAALPAWQRECAAAGIGLVDLGAPPPETNARS
jgi:heat shock protein HtpX